MKIMAASRLRATLTAVNQGGKEVEDKKALTPQEEPKKSEFSYEPNDEIKALKTKLSDAHVDTLEFGDHVSCLASLEGILAVMTDLGWDVDRHDKDGAIVTGNDMSDLKIEVEDDSHVTISIR
ncbi:hypothetical protein [Burkholderia phage BCSR5]|nr:hypothetical protein [Burkholderia phage BCSR5]